MDLNQITKPMLEKAAKNLNDVMGLTPPIKIGRAIKKETLEKRIIEDSAELQPGDTLEPGTIEILLALGINIPEEADELPKEQIEAEKEVETQVEAEAKEEVAETRDSKSKFVMKYLCRNPGSTEEEVQAALENNEYPRLADSTVEYWCRDMKNIMTYLKEIDALK